MNRRILIPSLILLLILAGLYTLIKLKDVEFLEFIVEKTMVEKRLPGIEPEEIRRSFAAVRAEYETGRLDRKSYRDGLLACAADMEKIQALKREDLQRLFGHFHRSR